MKVRILVRPLGPLNGHDWPDVGETIDLPDVVAEDMAKSGDVELVKPAKKAEKKAEQRPASKANVETRKK